VQNTCKKSFGGAPVPLDLQTIFALHSMRQRIHTMGDDDLLCETEEETCPTCGGLMFEDERDPFALLCPDCDPVPH